MSKELEEAKERLNRFKTIRIMYGNTFVMTTEQLEQTQKDVKVLLQALDNSIDKSIIENKIEELKEYISDLKKRQNEIIALGGDDLHIRYEIAEVEEQIKILQELLEVK